MGNDEPGIRKLAQNECWGLLRTASVGRLAVWVQDHPDIFPINYVVDHGTVVFRTASGTKVSAALSDAPVALEVDGYEAQSNEAWSVVIKGRAEGIREIDELMDTLDLPLFPWQTGEKNLFIRIVPTLVTGREFPVADPTVWQTPFSPVRRSPTE